MDRQHPSRFPVLFVIASLLLGVTAAYAAGPMRWLDLDVRWTGGGDPVSVHVPAQLAGIALGALTTGPYDRGIVHLGAAPDGLPTWNALLAMLRAMKPGQPLSLEAGGITLQARRTADTVRIHAKRLGDHPAELSLTLPADILGTLTVDEHGDLDFRPVLERLPTFPPGDILTGHDDRATVHLRIE